jgi:hypothetical protein
MLVLQYKHQKHTHVPQASLFNPSEIADLLWGHAVLGLTIDQELYRALEVQAKKTISGYLPIVTAKMIWAISELQVTWCVCVSHYMSLFVL